MRLIICDVGNAACAIVTASSGYTMMIDCGSSQEKPNPVSTFNNYKNWLKVKEYVDGNRSYPLTLLHITHPDDDHVRNAAEIVKNLPPYLLCRNRHEYFSDGDKINSTYVEELDEQYRTPNNVTIEWGFDINETIKIPVQECQNIETLKQKERNNSSILRYIKGDGLSVLFCGDLEMPGWEYLFKKFPSFVNMLKDNGVDVLVAPHHGHKSGFPRALFDAIGTVGVVIHSKDSEADKEGTDVSTQYAECSNGHNYVALTDKNCYYGKVLTTRSNGNIFISSNGSTFTIWADKASSNHQRVK